MLQGNMKGGFEVREFLDIFITDEDRPIIESVKNFVNKEIIPIREDIEKDKNHGLVQNILQGLTKLGLIKTGFPEKYSKMERLSAVKIFLISEEVARGDVGIAVAQAATRWALSPMILGKNEVLIDKFIPFFCEEEPHLACFAMTEQNSGCDIENLSMLQGKTIQTKAVLEGDEWVIRGSKRFASNSGVSDLYCIVCQTDPSEGEKGIALIYVPAGSEGLSFGAFEDKAGLFADRNCDIYLDDVRVPREYRASDPGEDAKILKRNITAGRVGSAAMVVGSARGIFDEVLKYTGERVVAGKPIRNHSMSAAMLADMAIGIETAKAYYLQVTYMLEHPERFGEASSSTMLSRASIAKVYAADTAVSIANKAIELMGAYGYMKNYHVEKYWRDSKVIQLWLGGAQLGRLDIAQGYYNL
ncbi:MAG: acyl-CoA dehydrogenase family protein [Deltaproteobacteria bacterium]|nr:acyl-CoA dehydrogenase family protein [Deltaproteobacteria bacterium]